MAITIHHGALIGPMGYQSRDSARMAFEAAERRQARADRARELAEDRAFDAQQRLLREQYGLAKLQTGYDYQSRLKQAGYDYKDSATQEADIDEQIGEAFKFLREQDRGSPNGRKIAGQLVESWNARSAAFANMSPEERLQRKREWLGKFNESRYILGNLGPPTKTEEFDADVIPTGNPGEFWVRGKRGGATHWTIETLPSRQAQLKGYEIDRKAAAEAPYKQAAAARQAARDERQAALDGQREHQYDIDITLKIRGEARRQLVAEGFPAEEITEDMVSSRAEQLWALMPKQVQPSDNPWSQAPQSSAPSAPQPGTYAPQTAPQQPAQAAPQPGTYAPPPTPRAPMGNAAPANSTFTPTVDPSGNLVLDPNLASPGTYAPPATAAPTGRQEVPMPTPTGATTIPLPSVSGPDVTVPLPAASGSATPTVPLPTVGSPQPTQPMGVGAVAGLTPKEQTDLEELIRRSNALGPPNMPNGTINPASYEFHALQESASQPVRNAFNEYLDRRGKYPNQPALVAQGEPSSVPITNHFPGAPGPLGERGGIGSRPGLPAVPKKPPQSNEPVHSPDGSHVYVNGQWIPAGEEPAAWKKPEETTIDFDRMPYLGPGGPGVLSGAAASSGLPEYLSRERAHREPTEVLGRNRLPLAERKRNVMFNAQRRVNARTMRLGGYLKYPGAQYGY